MSYVCPRCDRPLDADHARMRRICAKWTAEQEHEYRTLRERDGKTAAEYARYRALIALRPDPVWHVGSSYRGAPGSLDRADYNEARRERNARRRRA